MSSEDWDTCEATMASPLSSSPSPCSVSLTLTETAVEGSGEASNAHSEPEECQTLLRRPPPPSSRVSSTRAAELLFWTGFYGLAGLLSILMVVFRPKPTSPTLVHTFEFVLLVVNLVFWCLTPMAHVIHAFTAVCRDHPMVPASWILWFTGHLWLWSALIQGGVHALIFHYQKVSWLVLFHSLFLGLHGRHSLCVQALMIASLTSLTFLVTLSWAVHG